MERYRHSEKKIETTLEERKIENGKYSVLPIFYESKLHIFSNSMQMALRIKQSEMVEVVCTCSLHELIYLYRLKKKKKHGWYGRAI